MILAKLTEVDSPTTEKIQRDFLSCPICFEIYNEPKCLPCLHTLCAPCLLSYIKSQECFGARRKKGYPCPVCKQMITVKDPYACLETWVEEVQNNFLIQNMIDVLVEKKDDSDSQAAKVVPSAPAPPCRPQSPPSYAPPPVPVNPSAPYEPRAPSPFGVPNAPSSVFPNLFPRATTSSVNERNVLSVYLPPPRNLARDQTTWPIFNSTSEPDLNFTMQSTVRPASATSIFRTRVEEAPRFVANAQASYSNVDIYERYYMLLARNWADYVPPQLSDVMCLPKNNGLLLLDWGNRAIKFVKNAFLGRNVTTSMEVVGRPCSFALLDPGEESIVVVSLLNREKLYFIRVPDLEMVDVMDVTRAYRGITALSRTCFLASSENPPVVHMFQITQNCKHVSTTTVYQQGRWDGGVNFDIYKPYYMVTLTPRYFAISDVQRNSIIFFEVKGTGNATKAIKRYTLTPPEHSRIREAGGMCYNNGALYFADTGNHEIVRIKLGTNIKVETVLRRGDGVYKPASVCIGPRGELVVVNWEGKVTLYKLK